MSDYYTIKVKILELPHFKFKVPYCCHLNVREDSMISISDKSNDIEYKNCIDVFDLLSRFDDDCQYCSNSVEDSESCKRFMKKYLIKKESPDENYDIRGTTVDDQIDLRLLQDKCECKIDRIKTFGCTACPFCVDGECLRSLESLKLDDTDDIHEDCPLKLKRRIQ